MTALWAGALAGAVHVVSGPDHLAALGPSACREPSRAVWLGAQWGLGHGLGIGVAVLVARAIAAAAGNALGELETLSAYAELFVGVVLVVLGLRALRRPHASPRRGGAFAIGMLHGAAGAHHLLVLLPALWLEPLGTALYLAAYVLAATAAMALVGALVSRGLRGRSERAHVLAHRIAGFGAVAVGVGWLVF
ncbi:MAG: hypothetical protein R3B99_17800 [Polyangiales bacterium]